MSETTTSDIANWVPLESNPEVMNDFIHSLGVPKDFGFSDLFGLDSEMLSLVIQPCLAVVLIYPWSEERERQRDAQQKELQSPESLKDVYYLKQLVGNACGTIACIHSISNTSISLGNGPLKQFIDSTLKMTPIQRGEALGHDLNISAAHKKHSQEGQTDSTKYSEVDNHFICFVNVKGSLYELDGARESACPIYHGKTTPETFLQDTVKVIQTQFIEAMSGIGFGVLTFGPLSS